jgi:glycosyltransferase involved in cell wall biosynthesis
MARMLEMQGFSMEYMPVLIQNRRLWLKVMERIRAMVLQKKPVPVDRRISTAVRCAYAIERRLRNTYADVVFSPSSIPLARLRTDKLKVFHTDATFKGIIHQYPELANYSPDFIEEGHQLEHEALRNCDLAIYSSKWAADSAIADYGADPAKVHVIPFGSNLGVNPKAEDVMQSIRSRGSAPFKLLFLGVHWQRKGGAIALEAARILKEQGAEVQLTIIGCRPPVDEFRDFVRVIPFLDKHKPDDHRRLVDHIQQSHLLILPSKADCTPIVVNECNSLGVPCLTSDAGGLPEMIREGFSGHSFKGDAPAAEYAACVTRYMNDTQAYEALAIGAWQEYEQRLGWPASGALMRKVLSEALAKRHVLEAS